MHEGEIIRFLRKEKGISQAALAKDVCSVRHLSNIESGRSTVSYDLIMKFMDKLGTDVGLMMNRDVQAYGFRLFKDLKTMERLFFEWRYEELLSYILMIREQYILESYILKRVMYYKAVCVHEVRKDYERVQEILLEQMDAGSVRDIQIKLKHYCDRLDLNIINAYAVSLSYSDKSRESLELFRDIRNHLKKFDALNTEFGVKILFNITKNEFDSGDFKKSEATAIECIDICKETKIYRFMPDSYLYLARSRKALGKKDYKAYYKKSIYLSEIFGDTKKIASKVAFIINDNHLDMDQDVFKAEV